MKKIKSILMMAAVLVSLFSFQSCEDLYDIDADKYLDRGVIATFQMETTADWKVFKFTDYSPGNPTSWAWDMGDGTTYTTQDVEHTFTSAGKFTVSLTVGGSTYEKEVNVVDPDAFKKLVTGEVSKTWMLAREGTAASVGPPENPTGWWAWKDGALKDRTCALDDEYTFYFDGKFVNDTKGTFFIDWQANGGWNDAIVPGEGCVDETDPNAFVSAGSSANLGDFANGGDYSFVLDPQARTINISGSGAYICFPAKTNNGDLGKDNNPLANTLLVIVDVIEGAVYDELILDLPMGGYPGNWGVWRYWLRSYHNPADIPAMPGTGGDPTPDVTPTALFNTFASTAAADVDGLVPTASDVTITAGVTDPAGGGTAVGEYVRGTAQYADLKFQLAYDCQFDNFSTVSVDVYFPSSNDYSGGLSDQVDIFIADQTEDGGNFWQSWELYQNTDAKALDQWVTITFDISSCKLRNDLDLIGLKIGGENHNVDGTFYVRNFEFK